MSVLALKARAVLELVDIASPNSFDPFFRGRYSPQSELHGWVETQLRGYLEWVRVRFRVGVRVRVRTQILVTFPVEFSLLIAPASINIPIGLIASYKEIRL